MIIVAHGFRGTNVYFVQCQKPITYFIYMLLSKEETSTLKNVIDAIGNHSYRNVHLKYISRNIICASAIFQLESALSYYYDRSYLCGMHMQTSKSQKRHHYVLP